MATCLKHTRVLLFKMLRDVTSDRRTWASPRPKKNCFIKLDGGSKAIEYVRELSHHMPYIMQMLYRVSCILYHISCMYVCTSMIAPLGLHHASIASMHLLSCEYLACRVVPWCPSAPCLSPTPASGGHPPHPHLLRGSVAFQWPNRIQANGGYDAGGPLEPGGDSEAHRLARAAVRLPVRSSGCLVASPRPSFRSKSQPTRQFLLNQRKSNCGVAL